MAVTNRTQCPNCLDSGMDNLIHYEDGGQHCFSCGLHKSIRQEDIDINTVFLSGEYRDLKGRGISAKTCEFFDYEVGEDDSSRVHIANYYSGTELVGQKILLIDR